MIELVDREIALRANPFFASFILQIQEAHYHPLQEHNVMEPGEMYLDDQLRYVDQTECDEYNQKAADEYELLRDKIVVGPYEAIGYKIFKFDEQNVDNYLQLMIERLQKLWGACHASEFIFISEYPIAWLSQENDYPPVQAAMKSLTDLGMTNTFTGGVKVSMEGLNTFLPYLFWLVRCNVSLPPIRFTAPLMPVEISMCKYGNLHVNFFDLLFQSHFINEALKLGFEKTKSCYDGFSDEFDGRSLQ